MYLVTSVENQIQFWVPTNDVVNTIDYDTRFLITRNPLHPVAWKVTKREDAVPLGITKITLKQDAFNGHTDNVDELIADYYKTEVPPTIETDEDKPTLPDLPDDKLVIKFAGAKPQIKCGGSAKKFSTIIKRGDGTTSSPEKVEWNVIVPQGHLDDFDIVCDDTTVNIKCHKVYSLIGKTITIQAFVDDLTAEFQTEVIGL